MSILAGIGTSVKKDFVQAIEEALNQAKKNLPGDTKISLAVVFSSVEFAQAQAPKAISALLGNIPVIGCSGLAVISQYGVYKRGLAIMLLSLPAGTSCSTACVKEISAKSTTAAGEELGDKLLEGLRNIPRSVSTIFSDGLIKDGSELIVGLQEKLGISFPLVGACASDNLEFQKTYLYHNQEVFTDGACGILWGGRFNFGLGAKHGWKPIGKPHIVTKSSGNTVSEIDQDAAIKIYEEYFAKDQNQLKKDLKIISILYPIGIYISGEKEYLLRNLFKIEETGALTFQGSVPEGSQIRLMIGTKESCLNATQEAAEEVKKSLAGHPLSFAFVFDSVSRYTLLGRHAQRELEIISRTLGKDTPIMGLYTFGEQAPLKAETYMGKTYFHNQTITIMGIGG